MKTLDLLPLVLALGLTGCAGLGGGSRFDDALLTDLDASNLEPIVAARAAADTADYAHAKSERDTAWAEEQVDLARSTVQVSRAEVAEAELAVSSAEKSGTIAQLDAARKRAAYIAANSDLAREQLALRKRELERAKLAERLALEEYRLSMAKVDLAKAEAVQQLDRVDARRVVVKDYRKQVRFQEGEVDLARVRLNTASVEVIEAHAELDELRRATEALMSRAQPQK